MMRKGMIRKAAAFAMAGCLTAGLAGCSGGSQSGSGAVADQSQAAGETGNTAEKTKITFWAPFSGGDGDVMTAMVDEFNEQSADIEVEFMIFKGEEYYTKLLAAMTSDSAPTVAVNHITRVKEYVTDDLLEPLDELAEAQQVDWTDFTQKLQVASMVDGVHYCMPIDTHLLLMHYNVDEFKNMGLLADDSTVVVPKGEEAFFEFFENVKAQLDRGKMAISGTSANGLPMYLWSTLLAQYGGSICDETGKTATLNTEENKRALSTMMRMVDTGIWPKNQKNGGELFTGRIAAATINGDWAIPTFSGTEGLNFVSMPFPQIGEKEGVYADSHTLVIPKSDSVTDKERESAMIFMKWITDHTAKWASVGHIPSRQTVIDSEEFKSLPYIPQYAKAAQNASFFPQVCGVAGMTEVVQRELTSMVAGEQDVETTAANMQEQFQKILDSYN